MQFYQWSTDYQNYCKQTPKHNRESYQEFLPRRRQQQELAGVPTHRLFAEYLWTHNGSPYYNIHPKLVSRLCKVDMNKIPSTLLKMPHDLQVVNIRFAQKHDEFTMTDNMKTDIVARLSNTSGVAPAGSYVHSILMAKVESNVLFILDFDEYTQYNQPVYSLFSIIPQEDKSLEECLNRAKGQSRSKSYINMIENVLRLCVSIGFLADNPTICEADVLSKDRSEFVVADDRRREFLANRAKRKGKNGFNVGTDIMFLGERSMGPKRSSNFTGRELEYAHIRAGHPHLVRYGEGKKFVKMMWYTPTHVRPDKPFRS